LCWNWGNSSFSRNKGISLWNFVPNSELADFLGFFRHGTSTIASVVNFVRPTTIDRQFITLSVHICLPHMGVTQRVARVAGFVCLGLPPNAGYAALPDTDKSVEAIF